MKKVDFKRKLFFTGSISMRKIRELMEDITELIVVGPGKPIYLSIASSGGSVDAAVAFYEFATKIIDVELHTIGLGAIDSSAMMLFLAGKHRTIGNLATAKIHFGYIDFAEGETMDSNDMKREGRDMDILEENERKIFLERTKVTTKVLEKWKRKEKTLTAREMIQWGIAHGKL